MVLRRLLCLGTIALSLAAVHCSSDDEDGDQEGCGQPDQDGILGGDFTAVVTISDTAFSPVILTAQNSANIKLTIMNTGTKPHDFVIPCQVVMGCNSCFPDAAKTAPLAAGASATLTFVSPPDEGIYTITSDVAGDSFTAQFVLK